MGILLKDTQNVIPDVPEVTDLSWIIRSLVKKKKKKKMDQGEGQRKRREWPIQICQILKCRGSFLGRLFSVAERTLGILLSLRRIQGKEQK